MARKSCTIMSKISSYFFGCFSEKNNKVYSFLQDSGSSEIKVGHPSVSVFGSIFMGMRAPKVFLLCSAYINIAWQELLLTLLIVFSSRQLFYFRVNIKLFPMFFFRRSCCNFTKLATQYFILQVSKVLLEKYLHLHILFLIIARLCIVCV